MNKRTRAFLVMFTVSLMIFVLAMTQIFDDKFWEFIAVAAGGGVVAALASYLGEIMIYERGDDD